MKWSVSNSTFQYELNVERNACYECKISASTQAGEGLSSAPIIFSTPAGYFKILNNCISLVIGCIFQSQIVP